MVLTARPVEATYDGMPSDYFLPAPGEPKLNMDRTTPDLAYQIDQLTQMIERALGQEKNTHEATRRRAMALRYIAGLLDGLSFDEIAMVVGTSPKRLAAYLHGIETVPKRLDARLALLEEVLRNLHAVLERQATGRWFRTLVPAIGRTPLDAIQRRRADEVLAVTQSYLDPSYG